MIDLILIALFFRVDLDDEDRTHLYVSTKTTEVHQKTNRQRVMELLWCCNTLDLSCNPKGLGSLGPIGLVGLAFGILGVIAGIILGLKHSVTGWKRGSQLLSSPFSGWLAWHHKLGFIFGVFVLLWIFSGWLSMDHGRLFSTPNPTLNQETNLRGIQLSAALNQVTQEDLNKFSNVREFEISALDGRAMLIAKNGQTSELLFTEANSSPNQDYLISTARSAVSQAWPEMSIKSSYMVAADDVYGHLREASFPKETLRIILDDVDETWVHINLDDGHIVSVMDKSRRLYRWLFNGIHSLDLPGFSSKRPLWDIFMVVLMLTGTIFSITGLILAYKKLVRPITNYVKSQSI